LLGFSEKEFWKMTPLKVLTLFRVHCEFNPDRFKPIKPVGVDDIDIALGGL